MGERIRGFSSAVPAEPFFGQLFLLNALEMKPLEFAEGVVAHDHFSEGGTLAIAVLWLFGVVLPLTFLHGFSNSFLASLAPNGVFITFVDSPLV